MDIDLTTVKGSHCHSWNHTCSEVFLTSDSTPLSLSRLNSLICIAGSGYCSVLCSSIVGGAGGKSFLKRNRRSGKELYNISLMCCNSVLLTCRTWGWQKVFKTKLEDRETQVMLCLYVESQFAVFDAIQWNQCGRRSVVKVVL